MGDFSGKKTLEINQIINTERATPTPENSRTKNPAHFRKLLHCKKNEKKKKKNRKQFPQTKTLKVVQLYKTAAVLYKSNTSHKTFTLLT